LEIKAFFFFVSSFRLLKLNNPRLAFSGSTTRRLACSNARHRFVKLLHPACSSRKLLDIAHCCVTNTVHVHLAIFIAKISLSDSSISL
jgi:hypothetical protein